MTNRKLDTVKGKRTATVCLYEPVVNDNSVHTSMLVIHVRTAPKNNEPWIRMPNLNSTGAEKPHFKMFDCASVNKMEGRERLIAKLSSISHVWTADATFLSLC